MQTKTAAPIVLRESFTQKLAFPVKPDRATRTALKAAGWRFNGLHWWKNSNSTRVIKAKAAAELYAPANDNAEVDSNDVIEAAMASA